MPDEVASPLAQLVEPSVGLPGVYHYLGFVSKQPIATFSLVCHRQVGVLGSAGVLPEYRGMRVARNLLFYAEMEARKKGIATLILQTTGGGLLERALRIHGFKRAFKRICYTLPS
jgi:GNAT superfamily N-acetyltransferase